MKTIVEIPDELFEKLERLRKRRKKSRSTVYTAALREYLWRHDPAEVTRACDRLAAEMGDDIDPFLMAAADHILRNTEWDE